MTVEELENDIMSVCKCRNYVGRCSNECLISRL